MRNADRPGEHAPLLIEWLCVRCTAVMVGAVVLLVLAACAPSPFQHHEPLPAGTPGHWLETAGRE